MKIYFRHTEEYESCVANVHSLWEDAQQDREPNKYFRFAGLVKFYLGNFLEDAIQEQIDLHELRDDFSYR